MARWIRIHCYFIAILIYCCRGQVCPDSSIKYSGSSWAPISPPLRVVQSTTTPFFDRSKVSIIIPPCNSTGCGDPFEYCIPLTPPRVLQSRGLVRRQPREWGTARYLRDEGSRPDRPSRRLVSYWRLITFPKISFADMWRVSTPTIFASRLVEATSCKQDNATLLVN